mmetsp:Transcript_83038/g.243474  ORF Transcript_83038/g.243474 Transcript_83038/m.243474 type:complete len:264 (+) Transcript_83038:1193-1984(+)
MHGAVPMGERTPLHILSGDSHVLAFKEQRAKSQSLRCAPVQALTSFDALPFCLHDPLQAVVERESLGHVTEPHSYLLEQVHVHTSRQLLCKLVRRPLTFPLGGHPLSVLCRGLVSLGSGVILLELIPDLFPDLIQRRCLRQAFADEAVSEDVNASPVLTDRLVQQRLGEVWVVALVVSKAPVADDVKDHILAPLLPPLSSYLERANHCNRVIPVDVEDWHSECFAQIGAVLRGAGIAWVCREADLVVHDNVNGAANIKILNAS